MRPHVIVTIAVLSGVVFHSQCVRADDSEIIKSLESAAV
jgi:hypothetical protein